MAVKMNRKAIGTELKETYFRQAKENLKQAKENEIQEIFNMDFDSEKEEEAEGEES